MHLSTWELKWVFLLSQVRFSTDCVQVVNFTGKLTFNVLVELGFFEYSSDISVVDLKLLPIKEIRRKNKNNGKIKKKN
jgi:hypothetical protein